MSFNRLNYDTCAYKQNLYQSVGPGEYKLTEPPNVDELCYSQSPQVRLQKTGVSIDPNKPLIDIDSELLNLTRRSTNCPSKKYIPDGSQCGLTNPKDKENNLKHGKDCFFDVEDTRLSNPPCTLRGTGWNRWEWLCKNPQANLEEPYDFQIDSRILAKNNHRPLIPNPIDQFLAHPEYNEDVVCEKLENIDNTCVVPTSPPSVQWQSLDRINNY